MAKSEKAVFLDRDGTLNIDPGYLNEPEKLQLIEGVGQALLKLKKAGFLLVVVSNQSGVSRGLVRADVLPKIHDRLNELLQVSSGAKIDRFEYCPHTPQENCECRKPKPGMIERVCNDWNLNPSHCFMVGDRIKDVMAGIHAGCRGSALVMTGCGHDESVQLEKNGLECFVGHDLNSVAEWILSFKQP